jgi:hypothetical protein
VGELVVYVGGRGEGGGREHPRHLAALASPPSNHQLGKLAFEASHDECVKDEGACIPLLFLSLASTLSSLSHVLSLSYSTQQE